MLKTKHKLLIWIVVNLLISSTLSTVDAQPAHNEIIQNMVTTDQGFSFEIQVPWQQLQLQPVKKADTDYVEVSLPGWPLTAKSGAPSLPFLSQLFGVPFDVELDIKVEPGSRHIFNLPEPILPTAAQHYTYSFPGETLADPSSLLNAESVLEPDPIIYNSPKVYPGLLAEIANDGSLRQQRVVGLSIYPFQYHPTLNQVTVYESMRIQILFKGNLKVQSRSIFPEAEPFESFLEESLINYQQAKHWRSNEPMATQTEIAPIEARTTGLPWVPPDPSWRVIVEQEGFYALNYDILLDAEFPLPDIELSSIQMFNKGNEIAIKVIDANSNDHFDATDSIIFYAQAYSSKYTKENVFWLTYSQDEGLRMDTRNVVPDPANQNLATSFNHTLHEEKNIAYITIMPGSDDLERFVWTFASDSYTNRSIPFSINSVIEAEIGQFRLALLGYNDIPGENPDHHAVISLNGIQLADVDWEGRSWKIVDVPIPANVLRSGENTLEIFCPMEGEFDAYYVDWFEIDHIREFEAEADKLVFDYVKTGTWQFQINGFSTDDIMLFDISNPNAVVSLEGFKLTESIIQDLPSSLFSGDTEGTPAQETSQDIDAITTYTMSFDDNINEPNSYWAVTASNILTPLEVMLDTASALHDSGNGVENIIITHADFLEQAEDLATFRASQGLRTILVDLQDIFDQFSYGITDPLSIKRFLAYAYANWDDPAPSFVLLVGDGHYDPKDYLGYGRSSFVPPLLTMADPGIGETATDNRYVTLIGEDPLPDMMIGRLAVNTPLEAAAMINKIIEYEEMPPSQEWQRRVILIADNMEAGGSFPGDSEVLKNCCIPDYMMVDRVYLGVTHTTISAARAAVLAGINSGQYIVNYLGHATYSQWAGWDANSNLSGYLLETSSINSFTNQGMYPIVLGMTCYEGFFHNPHQLGSTQDALAEVITKAESKGAVASWSSTGASLSFGHNILNQGFVKAAFSDEVKRIGQATQASKLALWASGDYLDQIDTFMLFGDPATHFLKDVKNLYLPLILR